MFRALKKMYMVNDKTYGSSQQIGTDILLIDIDNYEDWWVAERLLSRVDRAAQNVTSPLAALEAVFMAHIDFVSEHPGVPRMLFGELQRPGETLPKRMVQTLIQRYGERLRHLLERGKAIGELNASLDIEAASVSFIGSIQGLVMQSLIAGDAARIRRDASGVFAIYRRGIGCAS